MASYPSLSTLHHLHGATYASQGDLNAENISAVEWDRRNKRLGFSGESENLTRVEMAEERIKWAQGNGITK
jgi:hypothetical protein